MPTPTPEQLIAWGARLAYVVVLILATLKSLEFVPNVGDAAARLDDAFDPVTSARDLVDAVRNVALFAGWGAVWVATGKPALRLFTTLFGAALTGFLLSAAVETLQLFSAVRTASVLDLITNTGGAFAGAVFMTGLVAVAWGMRTWKSYVGVPAVVLAASYLAAVFFEAVVPLTRAVPLLGVYGGPISRFGAAMAEIRLGMSEFPMLDVLLFFPLGLLSVAALVELKFPRRRAGWIASAGGLLLSTTAEIGRGVLGLPVELGVIVVHALAIALGAVLAVKGLPSFSRTLRGRRRALFVAVAYSFVLMLWAWRPFMPEWSLTNILEQFTLARFIPLEAARWRMDLFSVSDVAGQFFRYLPVGALLAVWPLRRRGPLGGPFAGLYLAAILEFGQAFVAGRFFDVGTDLAVQCSGVLMGWLMVRQAGFKAYGALLPPSRRRRPVVAGRRQGAA